MPYALAVQSAFAETFTAAQPIAASMNRIDFGGDMGEAFLNPATVTAAGALQTWDLPFIERNDLSQEFVVFQNLSDTTTTVTTVFHTAGGDVTAVRVLEPYRRGGLEVFDLGITSGVLWAHVTADQNIAVAVSDYDLPAAGANYATADTPAWGTLGVTGDGSTIGGFAGAEIQNNFASTVSLVNPSGCCRQRHAQVLAHQPSHRRTAHHQVPRPRPRGPQRPPARPHRPGHPRRRNLYHHL